MTFSEADSENEYTHATSLNPKEFLQRAVRTNPGLYQCTSVCFISEGIGCFRHKAANYTELCQLCVCWKAQAPYVPQRRSSLPHKRLLLMRWTKVNLHKEVG